MVASTQPLANAAGIRILEKGGNCVDACISMAACLGVLEPTSTGIGGDCFALYYDADSNQVYGMNGTGRAVSDLNLGWIKAHAPEDIVLPAKRLAKNSILKITIPGAVAGWEDSYNKWGSKKVTFSDCIQPSISLAENGFPISVISRNLWNRQRDKLIRVNPQGEDLKNYLPNDNYESPRTGQLIKNPDLASSLRLIADKGKDGFYNSKIGKTIVKELNKRGHPIKQCDLSDHTSTFVEPIFYEMLGYKLWEIPPNGSGIEALITLGLIDSLNRTGRIHLEGMKHNSTEYLHMLIECLKISFRDSDEYVNDYNYFLKKYGINELDSVKTLLSHDFLDRHCQQFKSDRAIENSDIQVVPNPMFKSDTVYFTATDKKGNACSFINSLYEGFGSGVIVPGCGFTLHSRGGNFNLNPNSKNCLTGGKRPYHTIIPGMITKNIDGKEQLYASFGIMGGYNQPQAQVQVFLNMLLFGMDPQEALDAPRICLYADSSCQHSDRGEGSDCPICNDRTCIGIEPDIDHEVINGLEKLGHHTVIVQGSARGLFGRGQIIRRENTNVYGAGSDYRGDGAATPLL